MKFFLKIILMFFAFSVDLRAEPLNDLANDLSNQIKSTQTIRMAILNFPYVDGFDSKGSKIVQERLTTVFFGNKKFSILERALLSELLEQKKLEMSGVFDEKTTMELGHMLGVQVVLTGTLIDVNDMETEINARIIDAATGEVLASGKTVISRIWTDKILIPKPVFEPTLLPKIEEVSVPESDFKIETEYADIETLEKYDEMARFDKSGSLPLEKVKKWKIFAGSYPQYKDISLKRAKEWEDYDKEFKEAEKSKAQKLEALKKDYQTLSRYLALTIISPAQKSEWAEKFMKNYGYGEDNVYKNEILKYVLSFEAGKMNWYEARNYCREKGMSLPTVSELRELFKNECHNDKYEKGRCGKWYWSSKEHPSIRDNVIIMRFTNGYERNINKADNNYVRCVRAGP